MKDQTNLAVADRNAPTTRKRHEQAKAILEEFIVTNDLREGDKLPTEETLRNSLGWSRVTIARALDALVWEGKLRRVQGSGTYVTSPKAALQRARKLLIRSWPYESDDDYGIALAAGIRDEAAQQRIEVIFHAESPVPSIEIVRELGVDGVLSICWQLDDLQPFLRLRTAGIPLVGLAMRSRIGDLPLVCIDNYSGMVHAAEHLIEHGHRDICFVTNSIDDSDVLERMLAFQNVAARHAIAIDPAFMLICRTHLDDTIVRMWWSNLERKPSAMILHGVAAPMVLPFLQRLGIDIPRELSIVLIDDARSAKMFYPPLSVIRQPSYELGRRGLAKLIGIIDGTEDESMEILPTELIVRESVSWRDRP